MVLVCCSTGQQSSATPAPQLREVDLSPKRLDEAYVEVISFMYKLHQDCNLVHGDLSEYNMLYYKKQVSRSVCDGDCEEEEEEQEQEQEQEQE